MINPFNLHYMAVLAEHVDREILGNAIVFDHDYWRFMVKEDIILSNFNNPIYLQPCEICGAPMGAHVLMPMGVISDN